MTHIEEILAYRKRLEALPERDKKILQLSKRAVNAMGFAVQNAHNENTVIKYEKQCQEAMGELESLLLKTT